MNKTKIEWTDYTWNPITGCENDCFYCYGKRIAKKFWKDNPNYEPKFYIKRLQEPYKLKKPSKIFVCSMAELFGNWIPDSIIEKVIEVARENSQHTFQFLTKNPERYLNFSFPKNCWLGTTVIGENWSVELYRLTNLAKIPNYKFISIEPILGGFAGINLKPFDLIIVGAMTGEGAIRPEKEWIDSIKHPNIFYKDNIKKYL